MSQIYLLPVPLAPNTNHLLSPITHEIILNNKYFLVEELKTARRFISSLKLGVVIDELTFYQVNKDTDISSIKKILNTIPSDAGIVIMSEAGCPGIADPGSLVVKIGHQRNDTIVPIPGPSSILMALMGSGFSGQQFTFNGYLPIDEKEKLKKLKEIENLARKSAHTQIFMETPYRNNKLLESMLQLLQQDTSLTIAVNITGENQQIVTKKIKDWKNTPINLHKQPCIFCIGI